MKQKVLIKSESSPAQVGGHTPTGRDGSPLQWLVVNPEGELLAVLDSESEAYWFTKNRGHAYEAVYFKAAFDYSAAPTLLAERDRLREALKAVDEWSDLMRQNYPEISIPRIVKAALAEGGKA